MTCFGWDASDYDWDRGPMDLAAAARDGIQFFTHKATEGTTRTHVHYGEALRRARDAGIPVLGAYHVVRSPLNAAAEVDHWLSYIDRETPWWRTWPDFFLQVDLEKWPYDPVPAEEGESVADLVEARTGRRAVIYASRGQYGDSLAGTSHELWNANYPTWRKDLQLCPAAPYRQSYVDSGGDSGPGWAPYSGRTPKLWQYTDNATIGTQHRCDANASRGSLDQLRALVRGASDMYEQYDRDRLTDTWGRVAELRGLVTAGFAADEVRDKAHAAQVTALTTALAQALGGGTSLDTAAVVEQTTTLVHEVRDEARQRFAELGAAVADERAARIVAEQRADRLAAALAKAGAALNTADDAAAAGG